MTIAPAPPEEAALVKMLLASAGVPATDLEIELVTSQYGKLREMIGMLYAVEEARYESPAMHFTATPIFAEWE